MNFTIYSVAVVVLLSFIEAENVPFNVGGIADLIQPGEGCYETCTSKLPKEYYWESYCMVSHFFCQKL